MADSTTIFDQETDARADAEADLTREFWGDGAGWVGTNRQSAFQVQSSDEPTSAFRLDHTPTSMKAIRDGIAAFRPKRRWRDDSTGPIERTREHGVVGSAAPTSATVGGVTRPTAPRRPSPERLAHRDATIADLAVGRFDGAPYPTSGPPSADGFDAELDDGDDLIPLTPTAAPTGLFGPVDPMIVRIAVVILAVVLAIPLALALRGDSSTVENDTDPGTPVVDATDGGDVASQTPTPVDASSSAVANGAASVGDSTVGSPGTPAATAAVVSASDAQPTADDERLAAPLTDSYEATETTSDGAAPAVAANTDSAASETDGVATVATVTEEAERELPDCSHNYTAGAGDSWYRIAAEAGVTPAALLEQNRATLDTVIFPDAEICLPAGATMPSPPTTAAPTTVAPTTVAPTTAAPATTTPAAPAPQPSYTRDEVQALIRETWPADQVDKALAIARRESNYIATADNGWCCVGVFQLYWTAHRGWLDDYGITSRDDLKDARKNIAAAYALYQSSGGWGPWGG
jgi:LysM repeat protein